MQIFAVLDKKMPFKNTEYFCFLIHNRAEGKTNIDACGAKWRENAAWKRNFFPPSFVGKASFPPPPMEYSRSWEKRWEDVVVMIVVAAALEKRLLLLLYLLQLLYLLSYTHIRNVLVLLLMLVRAIE